MTSALENRSEYSRTDQHPITNAHRTSAPSGCFELVKRALCCCIPFAQSHHPNQQTAQMCSDYLINNYGELIASTAQLITEIDLKSKKDEEIPVSQEESQALKDTATFINNHLKDLKRMIQHLRYYNDALHPRNISIGSDDSSDTSEIRTEPAPHEFESKQLDVVKRNGEIEKFAEEKIVIGLQEARFQHPLSSKQIAEIITQVKQLIAIKQADQINTTFLRLIVSQEASRRGAQLAQPLFMTLISRESVREHLGQIKGLEELSPEDCATLVNFLPTPQRLAETPVISFLLKTESITPRSSTEIES